jgi:hypothetical protein
MLIVSHTLYDGTNHPTDDFELFEFEDEARAAYNALTEREDVYCAAISRVIRATEPHWIEGTPCDS